MARFDSYLQGTPSWIELMTPDQPAAKQFYGDLFGWQYDEEPMGDQGGVYSLATIQGDQVAGVGDQMPELAGHPAFWNVYLAADDVDECARKAEAAGGKIEAGPFDVGDHGRMVALQDPTGARVSLWQAKGHIGSQRANEPGTNIWNELITPDVERGSRFYADVVGTGSERTPMPDGNDYVCFTVAGRPVSGVMPPPMEGMPPHWNVYFNVDSVDDTLTRVEQLGGKVVAPAFDVEGVGRIAVLSDPHGAMFGLMQNPPATDS